MADKLYVIGNPIKHSLSPHIHNLWLKKAGIDGEYGAMAPEESDLPALMRDVRNGVIKGLNVTVPFKQAVMPHVDILTEEARDIGAVNTVYAKDGEVIGDNTDGYGFARNLNETLPDFSAKDKIVCILGAGGAACAAAFALLHMEPAEIYICNRNEARALAMAERLTRLRVFDWDDRDAACEDAHLIVNCTSMGMVGHEPLLLSDDAVTEGAAVYDIVYNPRMTPLLRQAQRNGARIVTGEGMLAHQAALAFKHWYGIFPDAEEARRIILASLKND